MAGMYPDNQELTIFGEKVQWPGVDKIGKFTNGSFSDPLEKPSFIPAETINLILDNLTALIEKLGGTPDNTSIDQLAKLFSSGIAANKGIMRDSAGRAKVTAPQADDDIARKKEVDAEKARSSVADKQLSAAIGRSKIEWGGVTGTDLFYTGHDGVQKHIVGRLTAAKHKGIPASVADDPMYAPTPEWVRQLVFYELNPYLAQQLIAQQKEKLGVNSSEQKLIAFFSNTCLVQFPNMPTPDTFLSFEGYRWAEVNYGGAFFRASGGNASMFGSGAQGDAIRDIVGEFGAGTDPEINRYGNSPKETETSGSFGIKTPNGGRKRAANGTDGIYNYIHEFKASNVVPTANENRPVNYTVRLWKLEKI